METLELGLRNAGLVIAFGNKTKRIGVQEMMQIRTDGMVLDHIFKFYLNFNSGTPWC